MKDIEEEGNGKEGTENKEESPTMSAQVTEREATASLTALSTPVKKKGKR